MKHLFNKPFVAMLFDYFNINDGPHNDWTHSVEDIAKDLKMSKRRVRSTIKKLLWYGLITKEPNGEYKFNANSELSRMLRKISWEITSYSVQKMNAEGAFT